MQSTIARSNWENKTQHSFLSLFFISKEIFIQLFNILVIRNYKYNGRSSHFGKQQMIYIHYLSTKYEIEKATDQLRKYLQTPMVILYFSYTISSMTVETTAF